MKLLKSFLIVLGMFVATAIIFGIIAWAAATQSLIPIYILGGAIFGLMWYCIYNTYD